MSKALLRAGCAGIMFAAMPAAATNYTADPSNFVSVFNQAQAGDQITLSGNFGSVSLVNRSFAVPLRIDASAATFSDTLLINNVTGLAFTGGYFGSTVHGTRYNAAIAAYADTNLSFDRAYVVGAKTGTGLAFIGSTGLAVTGSTFDGLHSGIDFASSSYGVLDRNRSINAASDGFDIANSHFVTVTNLTCTAGAPTAGAHPDCVQLYSLAGNPVQSDITITNNTAHGPTQGFTSFDPARGGGLRFDISHNTVATSFPQGIACYACVDSTIVGNTLTTLPGARYRTNLHVVGGSNNLVFANTTDGTPATDDDVPAPDDPMSTNLTNELGWTADVFAGIVTSATANSTTMPANSMAVSNVPEPDQWLFLTLGLGLVGSVRRQRHLAA